MHIFGLRNHFPDCSRRNRSVISHSNELHCGHQFSLFHRLHVAVSPALNGSMNWPARFTAIDRLRHLLTFCESCVMGRLRRTRKLTERCVTRRFHRQMSRLVGDTTILWSLSSGSSRADRCHRIQRIRPGRGRSPGPSTADRLAT